MFCEKTFKKKELECIAWIKYNNNSLIAPLSGHSGGPAANWKKKKKE